jgi:hypothetical protein
MSQIITVVTKVPAKRGKKPEAPALDYAAFDRWVADLDQLVNESEAMEYWTERLDLYVENGKGGADLFDMPKRLLLRDVKTMQAKCEAFKKLFDPDDLYERPNGHWKLKREVISARLAQLVDSFPSKGPKAPEYFSQLLLQEVCAANPSMIDLESACRAGFTIFLIDDDQGVLTALSRLLQADIRT